MEAWQAILLGVIEGLTEYLPVSSTGHLLLAQRALGLPSSAATNAFAICIQAGAVAAVWALYRARLRQMALGVLGRDAGGRRLALCVLAAFVPAALAGVLLDDWIELRLFGLWPVVCAWFVGGVLILAVARRSQVRAADGRALEALTWRQALAIGVLQCAALWPGTSRSLVTILGGVLIGLELLAAIEFSFLLGVVTLFAATAYKAAGDGRAMLDELGALAIVSGFLAAFASAWASVRWMLGYLARHDLRLFGWWRIALALAVGALLSLDVLEAH
jgi:undecaprenyl-diphosphatase